MGCKPCCTHQNTNGDNTFEFEAENSNIIKNPVIRKISPKNSTEIISISNDETHIFQYNAQCLSSCPDGTEPNSNNICQIIKTNVCTSSEFKLNLDEAINEDNVKLTAKNYATEFYYTINHITKFTSSNFTMILYNDFIQK